MNDKTMYIKESEEISSLLQYPQNIVITTHKDPDGDALGSSLALCSALTSKGHSCVVILPSPYPNSFNWLPGINDVLVQDLDMDEIDEKMKHTNICFYLDFNDLSRIERLSDQFEANTGTKILIDHHLDPEPIADIIVSDSTASSTCEMVYDVLYNIYGRDIITEDIATCIYTGIVTDTGSFKYGVRPQLFLTVAKLMEAKLDVAKIQNHIFNSQPEKYLRLLGHCISNRMELVPEWKTGIFYLTKGDYKHFDIQRGDTEGLINYLMQLKEVQVGVFFKQQPNIVKLSLRSKGQVSVQEIANDLFNGGGHLNASGGYTYSGLHKAMDLLKDNLPKYLSKYDW